MANKVYTAENIHPSKGYLNFFGLFGSAPGWTDFSPWVNPAFVVNNPAYPYYVATRIYGSIDEVGGEMISGSTPAVYSAADYGNGEMFGPAIGFNNYATALAAVPKRQHGG